MSQSEIARLRHHIELEHEASTWALHGLASGVAQHSFISAKLRTMDRWYQQLHALVGEEQATDILCDVFERQDTPEQQSDLNPLDLRHYALRLLLHGNYAAFIAPSAQQILDVGCGTGLWACEMAQAFPHAQVTGLDLNLSSLPATWPANCQFMIGDVLQGLPFAEATFDFVHQRCLAATLPTPSWPAVICELVRVTCPGGWIELVDLGQSITNAGPATCKYLHWWRLWSEEAGVDTTVVEHLGSMLQNTGVSQVLQRRIIAPVGQWAGQVGTLFMTDLLEMIAAMSQPFCATLHLSPHDFSETIEALPAEWEHYHTAFHFYLACGQK